MRKYNVNIVIIALFVLAGCTSEPEPLNLAACDLEVKFGEPANSTFQCGSPITIVAHVLNRSSELCRRGSINLVRSGVDGTEEQVGNSQIIPRLEGGQQLSFDFLEQELIKGVVSYKVTVANGSDVVLPPEYIVVLDPGFADGFEENNTQARAISYNSSVDWQEIEDLLGVTQPTIGPESHPGNLLVILTIDQQHSAIQDLLESAGKDNCIDCHTVANWGTPEGQSPLSPVINGVPTHPEDQAPNINCLKCHTAGSSGSDLWESGSWEELPDDVACTTCHGNVFHAWGDYSFPSVWAVGESGYEGTHPGDEIWINIVKRYALCGDYED